MRERLAEPLRGPTRDGMDVRSAGGISQRQTGILDMREKLPHPRAYLIGSLDCITFAYSTVCGAARGSSGRRERLGGRGWGRCRVCHV